MKPLKLHSILLVFLLFIGCTATRDNKAVQRVMGKTALMNKVGDAWAIENPCVPTTPQIIPGKVITVIDSTYGAENIKELNHTIDSLLNASSTFSTGYNTDSLRKTILSEVQKKCKPEIITRTSVDTIRLPDPRLLNIQKQKNEQLQTTINEKDAKINAVQKKLTTAKFELYGLLALFGLATFLKIYLK